MRRITNSLALVAVVSLALGCAADTKNPNGDGRIAELVEHALEQIGNVPLPEEDLEYRIYHLDDTELVGDVTVESCEEVEQALGQVCNELVQGGDAEYCNYLATFFYAHDVPRCAVRFELFEDLQNASLNPLHVLDFSGVPLSGPAPTCGNGVLDDGETCDDGNHELWDGCDSNCEQEPFNGCEAIIQDVYERAGIAMVDQTKWAGPRSHLMVNKTATALREMSDATCDAAIASAADVCNELTNTMPFVGWCQPAGQFHDADGVPACSIRLNVWFQQLDEDFGVYTTSLPGVLAFTIR